VDNLLNVDIKDIPVRLLQSAGNISTSRIIAFLEVKLKRISTEFCKSCPDEFCRDSRQCIEDLPNWKDRLTKIWKDRLTEKDRNWKAKTSVLHCGGRCESTLLRFV